MNGNGTGDERTTVLYVRIPFHFYFPVPVFPCYPRKHAYTAVMRIVKYDLKDSVGSIQLCAGQDAGCEAAVHAMEQVFADEKILR